MSDKTVYSNFPVQTKAFSEKDEDWFKDCIEAAIDYISLDYHGIRTNFWNKVRNYNLANDIFDFEGIRKQLVPLYAKDSKYPVELQHYPIAIQKVDLLVGEELNRPFNFTARVTNDDAITEKEEAIDKMLDEFFIKQLQEKSQSQEEFKKALEEKVHYINTSYQDKREKLANQLLTYYYHFHNMKEMFNRGFYDLLIASEEIYRIDILGNEPIIRKCSPMSIHVIGGNTSPWVEDAEIIIEDDYWTPSAIIDAYYDELTDKQVKEIENSLSGSSTSRGTSDMAIDTVPDFLMVDATLHANQFNGANDVQSFQRVNEHGEIRVSRVVWKSKRKIGILTYFDEFGEVQQTEVHEKYKINRQQGDIDLTFRWINEAMEGTRIGGEEDNIYIKMQRLPVQNRSIDNISKCSLGYIGAYSNINTNRAMSLLDRLYPYQKAYNLFMNKLNFLYTKYKGPIYKLDFSTMPDDYEPEEWMYYADMLGWELSDPFNEGKKGAATGKLAGHLNQNSGVKEANLYNIIQQTIDMLNYIEMQAGSISGINKAREGQVHQRQAVSNVTREITQSAHITEKWFNLHNQVKRKALALFLETAKHAFKGRNEKKQYILDDSTIQILNIDGDLLNEASYGIQILDNQNVQELFNSLKELSHAALQNDKITISQIMDVYTDNSIASIKRKLEKAEQDKYDRDAQALNQQKEIEQMKLRQEEIRSQEDNEIKLLMQARELQKDIMIELSKISSKENLTNKELEMEEKLQKMEMENKKEIEQLKLKAIGQRNTGS